mmetsp:Transcript_7294/g.17131  ORF Transcript_7294/g.17131 Transcript_7294/m.17131 type:complete len:205 (-) Transcript_7294:5421-6035(-)
MQRRIHECRPRYVRRVRRRDVQERVWAVSVRVVPGNGAVVPGGKRGARELHVREWLPGDLPSGVPAVSSSDLQTGARPRAVHTVSEQLVRAGGEHHPPELHVRRRTHRPGVRGVRGGDVQGQARAARVHGVSTCLCVLAAAQHSRGQLHVWTGVRGQWRSALHTVCAWLRENLCRLRRVHTVHTRLVQAAHRPRGVCTVRDRDV